MTINSFFATKNHLTQAWTKSGKRIPVTLVSVDPMKVTQIKTHQNDGYQALQVAFGSQKPKKTNNPLKNHLAKTKLNSARFVKEIRLHETDELSIKPGDTLNPVDLVVPGDTVNVSGTSKGHGFTGVMKRWGFKGGPKTHGQSDRSRAPGSIGQGTDPGRVWKGKKMAGHSGNRRFTVKNLLIVKTDDQAKQIWIKGTIPGPTNGLVSITKINHKKFEGLFTDKPKKDPQADEKNLQQTSQTKPQQPEEKSTSDKKLETKE